jgi:hypothetical protein
MGSVVYIVRYPQFWFDVKSDKLPGILLRIE